jgi:hypothetical protein
LNPRLLNFFGREQSGVLYEAAEFFFADVMVMSLAGGEVFEGLVFHFQPLQMQDVEVEVALIPDLALLQFHCATLPVVGDRWQPIAGKILQF